MERTPESDEAGQPHADAEPVQRPVGITRAAILSPAVTQLVQQSRLSVAGALAPALTEMVQQSRLSVAGALSPALTQLVQQSRAISASFVLSPEWQRFTDDFAERAEDITARIAELTDPSGFARIAESVMATAAVIDGVAAAELDEPLDTYEFADLSEPGVRLPVQATAAVVVFIYTFVWVVDNYDLASKLNTLTGIGPLLMAQLAWSLTKRVLDQLAGDS